MATALDGDVPIISPKRFTFAISLVSYYDSRIKWHKFIDPDGETKLPKKYSFSFVKAFKRMQAEQVAQKKTKMTIKRRSDKPGYCHETK